MVFGIKIHVVYINNAIQVQSIFCQTSHEIVSSRLVVLESTYGLVEE